ncbi:MAG: adenylyltransferase/cytidyltransferase family protein [Acidobacteria bacterium]|nr:adenylyltransferase/cytidyltransferase family protein [Acidobacteriota bacterium]
MRRIAARSHSRGNGAGGVRELGAVVLTYGTFDLFHIGHLNLLRRAKELGGRLIVGVSTDEFNLVKGKRSIMGFAERCEIVRSIRYVDEVIAETSWSQKVSDVRKYGVHSLVMGADWKGKFDDLDGICRVVYLPRTEGISSTNLKLLFNNLGNSHVQELKKALDVVSEMLKGFQ